MTGLIEREQRTGRLCQTVTAEHLALLPELAKTAMQSKITGAAAAIFTATGIASSWEQLPSALKDDVLAGLRRDADGGDVASLSAAVILGSSIGFSPVEQLTYAKVFAEKLHLPDSSRTGIVKTMLQQGHVNESELSAKQVQAAISAAQRLLDAIRAQRKPG